MKIFGICISRRIVYIAGMMLIFYFTIHSLPLVAEKHNAYLIIAILLFLMSSFPLGYLTQCPKCSKWITTDESFGPKGVNAFLPLYKKYCQRCGQNLDICAAESDEIVKERLKKLTEAKHETPEIHIKLLDKDVDVWRPVRAEKIDVITTPANSLNF